jgi:hypothetical protein
VVPATRAAPVCGQSSRLRTSKVSTTRACSNRDQPDAPRRSMGRDTPKRLPRQRIQRSTDKPRRQPTPRPTDHAGYPPTRQGPRAEPPTYLDQVGRWGTRHCQLRLRPRFGDATRCRGAGVAARPQTRYLINGIAAEDRQYAIRSCRPARRPPRVQRRALWTQLPTRPETGVQRSGLPGGGPATCRLRSASR